MNIYTIEVREKWEWIRFGAPKQGGVQPWCAKADTKVEQIWPMTKAVW